MWATLIQGALSSVGGLIAALAVVAGLVGSGAFVEHRIDQGQYASLEASYAKAQTAAEAAAAARQKAMDDNALSASTAETSRQHDMAAATQAQLAYLRQHPVSVGVPCIPLGLVRLLGAAGLGVSPDNLALPAGKSDRSCSAITADDLAQIIVGSYGRARANAAQLDALTVLLKKQQIAEKQ
jgi:hypothetical protein